VKTADQQNWEELVRRLLLGTDQLPAEELQTGDAAADEETEDHQQLLEAIGITQILRQGARQLPLLDEALPSPAPEATQAPCSGRSVQHLQAILDGHHQPALPEFAQLLQKHQKQLPHEALPELLEQCREKPELWLLIQPILGTRGRWLLQQHPHWSALLPTTDALESWPLAATKDQLALLTAFRREDPEAALQSLTDHWLEMDHQAQARVLPALAEGLSEKDEAFLEHCRLAKRKNVRLAATDLLASLPASRLQDRLWEHAQECLPLQANKLELILPEDLPKATEEDGIYPTGSKTPGGLRLNWLQQLLERIPFTRWENHWQKAPLEIIQMVAKVSYGNQLLQAFTKSLLRHPNLGGTEAMIKWWLLTDQQSLWNNTDAKQLLQQATPGFFNASLLTWLQQFGPLVPNETLPAYWLLHSPHAWQPALSKMIVLGFQDVVQGRSTANWDIWHYRSLLEKAAYHSDPQLLPLFKSGWSFRSSEFGRWHADLEKMLQILHFRGEMARELGAGGGLRVNA
jgi:hypothetical protein